MIRILLRLSSQCVKTLIFTPTYNKHKLYYIFHFYYFTVVELFC